MVRSTRLGQRSASRPRTLHATHQLPRSLAAGEPRGQPVQKEGERRFRPRPVRPAAELRRAGQFGGRQRRPAVARSVRQRAGASRRRPSHLVSCPLHRRNARRPRRYRHLRHRYATELVVRGPFQHSFANVIYLLDKWCLQCFDAVGWAAGMASGL